LLDWALYFFITQAIEVPVYVATLPDPSRPRRALIGFGASALTHPIVWFVLKPLLLRPLGFGAYAAFAETFAVLAEAAYLAGLFRVPARRALLCALAANGASFAAGLLFSWLRG